MSNYQNRFIRLALNAKALRFGEFTLKSGRISPYFFNAGAFQTNLQLAGLAACYADALEQSAINFDVIFGPAYKGIPLATALAIEYAKRHREVSLSFNRKEVKDHGEGGYVIGAPLDGRNVLIIDDVITAGTAICEALAMIRANGGHVTGIVVALDREEMTDSSTQQSAIQSLAQSEQLPIVSIATMKDLLAYSQGDPALADNISLLQAYQARYCIKDSMH